MRKAVIASIVCCMLTVGLLTASVAFAHENHEGDGKFTKHFDKTLFSISEAGVFSMEVLPDESEYKIGKGVVGIVVHDSNDEDITGGKLTISFKNRDTGAEAATNVSVTEKGGGLYIVKGLDLTQEGNFELKVTASKGNEEDSATFLLPEAWDHLRPKGKY